VPDARINADGSADRYVVDHLGSVRGIVDAAGNVIESASYGPFGEASGAVGTFWYACGLFDQATGLVHFGRGSMRRG
jgi:hypothetical protein